MLEEDMLDGWMDGWRGCQVEGQNYVLFIISLVSKKTIVCLCQWAIDSCKEKGEVSLPIIHNVSPYHLACHHMDCDV